MKKYKPIKSGYLISNVEGTFKAITLVEVVKRCCYSIADMKIVVIPKEESSVCLMMVSKYEHNFVNHQVIIKS